MCGVPIKVQRKRIRLGTMRLQVQLLASLSGLRIPHCHELWCRSQMRLGSGTAVAVVYTTAVAVVSSGYSSDLTPSLETSIYCGCGPKKTKKERKKERTYV